MSLAATPIANQAKSDFINEAQALLDGRYITPSLATLRVRLERSILLTAKVAGITQECGNAVAAGSVGHVLKVNQIVSESLHRQTATLGNRLSILAHDQDIDLDGVIDLINEVEKLCGRHERLQASLLE